MSNSPIPENFSIKFTPGRCGVCEAEITSGIFCSKCLPAPKTKELKLEEVIFKSINQMKRGEAGFITIDAIFEADDLIWLINSFLVSSQQVDELTVMLVLDDQGDYLVQGDIDWDKILVGRPTGIDDKWISPLYIVEADDDDPEDYEEA